VAYPRQPTNSGAAELARIALRSRAQTVLAQLHRYLLTIFGGAQGLTVMLNVHYHLFWIIQITYWIAHRVMFFNSSGLCI
jgi:hypothetical protein